LHSTRGAEARKSGNSHNSACRDRQHVALAPCAYLRCENAPEALLKLFCVVLRNVASLAYQSCGFTGLYPYLKAPNHSNFNLRCRYAPGKKRVMYYTQSFRLGISLCVAGKSTTTLCISCHSHVLKDVGSFYTLFCIPPDEVSTHYTLYSTLSRVPRFSG
jgi:hypothetical protein